MQRWREIINAALWAPSPHNTQPWRVRLIDESRAELFLDRARTLPGEDTTGDFIRCGMGMFIAAMELAAANANCALRFELVTEDDGQPLQLFARLSLEPAPQSAAEFSSQWLQKRMTSRLPSTGRQVSPEISRKLGDFALAWGQQYMQIDDAALIEDIMQENVRAVFEDLNMPSYHDEIAQWFRYSERESLERRDGLDARCMALSSLQLRTMRDWPQVMKWKATRWWLWRVYRRHIGAVTHLGLLSGPFFQHQAAVEAGRFLLRFWLHVAQHGIYVFPFGNLVTNAAANRRMCEWTGLDKIWIVFRIGYTATPARSRRRTLEEILFP